MRLPVRRFYTAALFVAMSHGASADFVLFDTGPPIGTMAMGSRPAAGGKTEIEAADDFVNSNAFTVNSASFTGLITGATPTVGEVTVEIYRVFPKDSVNPPSGIVPTRVNSPSDNAFDTRDSVAGQLTFTTTTVANSLAAPNSVLLGINKIPNQTTGGEGAVTGKEVTLNVTFSSPFNLPPDHYFFVPQVQVTGGEFYWLSGPRPLANQFAFAPDLQAWIRNAALQPDWLRVGTDIVGGTSPPTFNGNFSLTGVPGPSSVVLLGLGAALLFRKARRVVRGEGGDPGSLAPFHLLL